MGQRVPVSALWLPSPGGATVTAIPPDAATQPDFAAAIKALADAVAVIAYAADQTIGTNNVDRAIEHLNAAMSHLGEDG